MVPDKIYDFIFAKNKALKIFMLFAIIALIYTMPYIGANPYIACEDAMFHVQRVYEMAENIKHGEWLPSLQESNLQGMGYLVDVFYPSTFMYLPALMVVAGLNPMTATTIMIYIISLATAFITFFAAKTATKNTKFAFYMAIIYTLFPFRVFNCIVRGFIGEIIGTTFLPLVIFGAYNLVKNKKWKMLAIGMILLTYSHLISLFLASMFLALYFFIYSRKEVFNKEFIIGLIKATLTTIIVGAGFLVPFMGNITSDSFKMDLNKESGIQLIDVTFGLFRIPWFISIFIQAALIFGLIKLKKKIEKKEDKLFATLIVSIIFGVVMLTNLFPWELCEKIPLLSSIQFSYRAFHIISVLASILVTKMIISMKDMNIVFVGCFASLVMILVIMPKEPETLDAAGNISWNKETKTYTSIVAGEYMPSDLYNFIQDLGGSYDPRPNIVNADGNHLPANKEWHTLSFNTNDNYNTVETDITYYRGYKAYLNGIEISVFKNNGRVCLKDITPGSVLIRYEVDNIQKITAIISILAAIIFLGIIAYGRKEHPKKALY